MSLIDILHDMNIKLDGVIDLGKAYEISIEQSSESYCTLTLKLPIDPRHIMREYGDYIKMREVIEGGKK